MLKKIKKFLFSLWAKRMRREIRELYFSDLILNFASSALLIFEPIYLYLVFAPSHTINQALQRVLFFYLGVYVLYLLVVPLGAKLAKKIGYEHSMAFSLIFTVLFYTSLFGIKYDFYWFWLAMVLYAVSKILYWPAYQADFARFSTRGNQGRQVAGLTALRSMVLICGPAAGGLVLKFFGFGAMFGLFSLLILSAAMPLLATKEKFTPAPFAYGRAFSRLWQKENRRRFFCFVGFGEELIAMVIWPIFIYVAVFDFFKLGVLLTISTAFSTIIFLFIGHLTDKSGRRQSLTVEPLVHFWNWLATMLVRGAGGVFIVNAIGVLSKEMIVIPLMANVYREAKEDSVMNAVVFFEMSLVVGKIAAIIIGIVLLQFFVPGWNILFLTAAGFSLFYALFKFHGRD